MTAIEEAQLAYDESNRYDRQYGELTGKIITPMFAEFAHLSSYPQRKESDKTKGLRIDLHNAKHNNPVIGQIWQKDGAFNGCTIWDGEEWVYYEKYEIDNINKKIDKLVGNDLELKALAYGYVAGKGYYYGSMDAICKSVEELILKYKQETKKD